MIRADRGPFKDNVTVGGTHIHHAVPGMILLIVGAFIGVAAQSDAGWSIVSALLVGVGVQPFSIDDAVVGNTALATTIALAVERPGHRDLRREGEVEARTARVVLPARSP